MSKLRDKKWTKRGSSNKGQNGITLIALVITVIVLLILAGISIMMLTGDNSILKNAADAKELTGIAQIEEAISLAYTAAISKDYTAVTNKTFAEIFQEELEKEYGEGKVTVTGEDGNYIVTIEEVGSYTVKNGKVSKTDNMEKYYAYIDITTGNIAKTEPPALIGNMHLVTFDEYDGGETEGSRWANAMTSDGSMWVWIPRYAYKITSGYHTNTAGTIEIKFVDTNNKCLDGSNETIETDPSKITYTEEADGNQVQDQWLLHPAFSSEASNGGGFGEISGFWFAKFETSGSATEETGFKSIAATSSLTAVSIGDFYKYARQQLYGETGSVDSYDGYTSFGQSHIVKNSEWGAVAYLSKSVYGSNDTVVTENYNSVYTTGGSSTASTVYTTNANQSTTQNAYGVYDMRGTSYELVASYVNNGSYLSTYGGTEQYNLYGATTEERSTSTKYKTVYQSKNKSGDVSSQSSDYTLNSGMKGDAVWETSNSYSNGRDGAWQTASARFPYSTSPFFVRGGMTYYTNGGVFFFENSLGRSPYYTSRLALVP